MSIKVPIDFKQFYQLLNMVGLYRDLVAFLPISVDLISFVFPRYFSIHVSLFPVKQVKNKNIKKTSPQNKQTNKKTKQNKKNIQLNCTNCLMRVYSPQINKSFFLSFIFQASLHH